MATKEHVGLAVAAIGVWYARPSPAARRHSRSRSRAARVALRRCARRRSALRAGRRVSAFESRYDGRRRSTAATCRYLAALLLPLGAAAARARRSPRSRRSPSSALNMLSSTSRRPPSRSHYAAVVDRGAPRRGGFGAARLGARPAYARRASPRSRDCPAGPARTRRRARRRHDAAAAERCALVPPRTPPSARRTRSARTSPRGSGSSASRCSRRRSGWPSTHAG